MSSNSNSAEFVENTEEVQDKAPNLGQNSRRAYLRELRKVVDNSDVLLMILDARDPLGTRSSAVEDMIMSDHRKKIVYVLNKSDLVPREVLIGWLSYLRKIHPTIPFKSNTQSQKGNLGRMSGKVSKQNETSLQTSQAVGAEELLSLLKNYSRVGDSKSIITVGTVGFPNVGKSSLINSLMRTRAVGVSSVPGFTKVTQEVILDKNIRLMDSPGIVFADGDSTATALRNCVNVEDMEDVITPVQAILERCPQEYLMQLYTIPRFKAQDAMSFLALVAKITGKLKKGGIPNIDAAARGVLHDWNIGKIKYYCRPPRLVSQGLENQTKVVSKFDTEFDVSNLNEDDIRVLDELEAYQAEDGQEGYVAMEELGEALKARVDDNEIPMSSSSGKKAKSKGSASASSSSMDVDDCPQLVTPPSMATASSKKTKKSSSAKVSYDFDTDFQYSN